MKLLEPVFINVSRAGPAKAPADEGCHLCVSVATSAYEKSPPTVRRWGAGVREVETLHRGMTIMSRNSVLCIFLFVGVSFFQFGAEFGHGIDRIPAALASLADDLFVARPAAFVAPV